MRNQIIGGLFVAVMSASVGTWALDDITVWTASPLADLTWSVLAACPSAAGLSVVRSGGTSTVESYLRQGTQTVGPMTRFISANNTCGFSPTPIEAEGLLVAIQAISVVVNAEHRASCDPDSPAVGAECTKDVATGLRHSDGATPLTCVSNGAAVTINDWKAVLRLVYFGITPSDTSSNLYLNERDCSDPCRVELVSNWGKLFENACSGGDCSECASDACTAGKCSF